MEFYFDSELLKDDGSITMAARLNKILKSLLSYENDVLEFEALTLLENINIINTFCKKYSMTPIVLHPFQFDSVKSMREEINKYYRDFLANNNTIYIHLLDIESYDFSDEEYTLIQNNINFLRDAISKSKVFSDEHKARLLAKLEKLQAEFHQKMATLDKAQGTLLSIGRTLRRFGKEVNPIIDKVNETLRIVFRVEDKGNNLPRPENQIGYEEPLPVEMIEE